MFYRLCSFVVLSLAYPTPFVFLTPFNLLASSLSVEGCKIFKEGRKKRDEDTF